MGSQSQTYRYAWGGGAPGTELLGQDESGDQVAPLSEAHAVFGPQPFPAIVSL